MYARLILRIVSMVLVIFVWLLAGLIFGLGEEDSPVLALIIFFAGTWLTWAVVQAAGDYRRRRISNLHQEATGRRGSASNS